MRLAAFRPKRRHDVGGACAPVEAGNYRLLDSERIHQSDDIDGYGGWLAVAHRFIGKKPRRAVAAQIRDDHAIAGLRQQGRYIDETVNVVGPAVQQDRYRTVRGADFGISDIQ